MKWMNEEGSCYKQMVTDHSPCIPRESPFFVLSLTPNPYIYTFSAMPVYFCFDPAILPDTVLIIPPWGCFHLLVQFDWKALAALPAVPTGLPRYPLVSHLFRAGAAMQSFIYILHLTPPTCCFQQGAISKIQQDFTSPSTRMYPSAFLSLPCLPNVS